MTTKLIDNNRLSLNDALQEVLPNFKHVSIATGYWDLPGFQLLQEKLKDYDEVRLLIGQEPLPPHRVTNLDLDNLDETFPEVQVGAGLANLEQTAELRESAKILKSLISEGKIQVKILRGSFLHAKAYIFGKSTSNTAIGIIGSSNFTAAGLTKNRELNVMEDSVHSVVYPPQTAEQPHSHLSWFDEIWNSDQVEDWNGKFTEIIDASPLGDLTFSQYHMYIKALYEIYGDELVGDIDFKQDIENILFAFQNRNAKLLKQKLEKSGVAILADSVGLGKTITAGAILKTYIEEKDANRVYVIAPASLTQQWTNELAEVFKLVSGFKVISLQDAKKIQEERELDQYAPVDLFIVDEAHNLRSGGGSRFDELLDWFSNNPESHVLLLTATPINNSLKDLKNQIQLGSKGKLHSVPVLYPTDSKKEVIDFFEAIERLNKEIRSAITAGNTPDYDKVNMVMKQGLRPYLVRTTRAGIMKEFGGIKDKDGNLLAFPESINKPKGYAFDHGIVNQLKATFQSNSAVFEGIKLENLDLQWLLDLTQRTEHPIDTILRDQSVQASPAETPFEIIFQVLLTLGFSPYKADVYKHKYYAKSVDQIKSLLGASDEEKLRVSSQLSIHNMLRVTLLKRLESSQFALRVSIENYGKRLEQFRKLLDANKIGRIKDLNAVIELFGDALDENGEIDPDLVSEFELVDANPEVFNIAQLKKDLDRDAAIIKVLLKLCEVLAANDDKLQSFAELLQELQNHVEYGKKVLVFSYYADTVTYIQKELSKHLTIPNFESRAGFVSGGSKAFANELAKRFSPKSKKASDELMQQGELDFLFATDVLSEGQNLQDCGVIVNFDLHWNPVRMIQRNGRINRLGSTFEKVHIFNMHPDENLNEYLSLVERLNNKIDQIKFSIGTDQSVLGEEANPKEFVDIYNPGADGMPLDENDDDEDLLGEDTFVKELREFDATASEQEKELVKSIGIGKWGYLPQQFPQFIGSASALALVRVSGTYNHNEESFRNHVFVAKKEKFEPVSNFSALSALRVSKAETARIHDTIGLDRDEIAKKSFQLAKFFTNKKTLYFKRTPKVNEAIGIFAGYQAPDLALDQAFDKVQTKQTLKRAGQIVRLINKEQKSKGSLSADVVQSVEGFIKHMATFEAIGITLDKDSIQGVLYFAG
jgi:ERCC4-related helicase